MEYIQPGNELRRDQDCVFWRVFQTEGLNGVGIESMVHVIKRT
jgi:hypothetical protein